MQINSYKTATKRTKPSRIAKYIIDKVLPNNDYRSLLDYGCGKGDDCNYYVSSGLFADGYDPHYFPHLKNNVLYDIVSITYVLNVIDTIEERKLILQDALSRVAPNGICIIGVRSEKIISSSAKKEHWKVHNDGFITSEAKQTFQKGFSITELVKYVENIKSFKNIETIFNDDCVSILLRC